MFASVHMTDVGLLVHLKAAENLMTCQSSCKQALQLPIVNNLVHVFVYRG